MRANGRKLWSNTKQNVETSLALLNRLNDNLIQRTTEEEGNFKIPLLDRLTSYGEDKKQYMNGGFNKMRIRTFTSNFDMASNNHFIVNKTDYNDCENRLRYDLMVHDINSMNEFNPYTPSVIITTENNIQYDNTAHNITIGGKSIVCDPYSTVLVINGKKENNIKSFLHSSVISSSSNLSESVIHAAAIMYQNILKLIRLNRLALSLKGPVPLQDKAIMSSQDLIASMIGGELNREFRKYIKNANGLVEYTLMENNKPLSPPWRNNDKILLSADQEKTKILFNFKLVHFDDKDNQETTENVRNAISRTTHGFSYFIMHTIPAQLGGSINTKDDRMAIDICVPILENESIRQEVSEYSRVCTIKKAVYDKIKGEKDLVLLKAMLVHYVEQNMLSFRKSSITLWKDHIKSIGKVIIAIKTAAKKYSANNLTSLKEAISTRRFIRTVVGSELYHIILDHFMASNSPSALFATHIHCINNIKKNDTGKKSQAKVALDFIPLFTPRFTVYPNENIKDWINKNKDRKESLLNSRSITKESNVWFSALTASYYLNGTSIILYPILLTKTLSALDSIIPTNGNILLRPSGFEHIRGADSFATSKKVDIRLENKDEKEKAPVDTIASYMHYVFPECNIKVNHIFENRLFSLDKNTNRNIVDRAIIWRDGIGKSLFSQNTISCLSTSSKSFDGPKGYTNEMGFRVFNSGSNSAINLIYYQAFLTHKKVQNDTKDRILMLIDQILAQSISVLRCFDISTSVYGYGLGLPDIIYKPDTNFTNYKKDDYSAMEIGKSNSIDDFFYNARPLPVDIMDPEFSKFTAIEPYIDETTKRILIEQTRILSLVEDRRNEMCSVDLTYNVEPFERAINANRIAHDIMFKNETDTNVIEYKTHIFGDNVIPKPIIQQQ